MYNLLFFHTFTTAYIYLFSYFILFYFIFIFFYQQKFIKHGTYADILATSGESLKIWEIKDGKEISLKSDLINVEFYFLILFF